MAVRRERVVLELQDDFTTKMARAVAATAVMNRELHDLDGTSVATTRSVGPLGNQVDTLGNKSRRADTSINQLTGRLRLLTDVALILGPAMAPLGAAAVGGVVALSAQLGTLAGVAGVSVLALNGVGDGLEALNAYQLEPTAENLEKLNQEMARLGPAGEHFVRFLDDLGPELRTLQMAARNGLLPGVEEGIDDLMERLPQLRSIIRAIAKEGGRLAADAGAGLAGEDFDDFFEYLRTDGVQILDDTARTVGNLTETVANLFVAFAPTQLDFSGGLLEWSRGLADASADLESNPGFQRFLEYIEETGPQAVETLGALADAGLAIGEAVAPLGGPVLQGLEGVATAFAVIARSDIGTPIFAALGALALYNRAAKTTQALNQTTWGGKAIGGVKAYTSGLIAVTSAQERAMMTATQLDAANKRNYAGMARAAAGGAGLALSMSGLADSTGLANTAMLSILGPWGAAAGVVLDLMHATDGLEASITAMNAAMDSTDPDQIRAALEGANAELEKASANTILGTSFLGDTIGGFSNAVAPLSNVTKTMGLLTGTTREAAQAQEELEAHLADVQSRSGAAATQYIDAARGIAEAQRRAQEAIEAATEAMREQRSEALRALNAELNYEQAIDDARKALKENGKTVDETTEKGRANLRALYALADGWNQQSDAAKNARGSLRQARQNFIETAQAMGMGEDAAKRLADRLFEIPPKRQTQILVESGKALQDLSIIKARLDAIRDKSVNINFTSSGRPMGGVIANDGGQADGGTIPGRRLPYGDKLLYMLAPGEEVISNRFGQADRNRALLKAINADRLAEGGTAGDTDPKNPARRPRLTLWADPALANLLDGARGAAGALKVLERRVTQSEKALDKERANRDKIADQMSSLAGSISSGLRTDIFATPDRSPWAPGAGGGVGGVLAALQGDIDRAEQFEQLQALLESRGLNGSALQALLMQAAEKNDLGLLQQFAGASQADLAAFQSLYALRDQKLAATGQGAAQAIFGEAYAAQTKILEQSRDEAREANRLLRRLEAAIDRADKNNTSSQQQQAAQFVAGVGGAAVKGKRNRVYNNGGRRGG